MTTTKRIFVYEYLSGGGPMPDEAAAAELLPLGLTMRDAMAADLLAAGDCAVTVASSVRVRSGEPAGAAIAMPRAGEAATDFVARQTALHDAAWIVAPETGGLLAQMARLVGPARWLGCSEAAIALCTGKGATLRHLAAHEVPTPLVFAQDPAVRRWVVKPDDGAGCVDTRIHHSRVRALDEAAAAAQPMTVEPWVDGEALSVSLLCGAGGTEVLAINRQRIGQRADGLLSFDGLVLNAIAPGSVEGQAIARLAAQVGRAIPGLRGFAGIDVVLHPQRGPVLIEVNPRVTVAYAGMSAALGRNLAAEIVADKLREPQEAIA